MIKHMEWYMLKLMRSPAEVQILNNTKGSYGCLFLTQEKGRDTDPIVMGGGRLSSSSTDNHDKMVSETNRGLAVRTNDD